MPTQEPPATEGCSRRVGHDWWPPLRFALIAWSAIGVLRFVASLAGTGRVGVGHEPAMAALSFVGSISLLLGSVAASRLAAPNTALTVGAAAILLYAGLAAALGSGGDHHLPTLLSAVQHVLFPVAVVAIKVRATERVLDQRPLERLGATGSLLCAAQVPGLAAMGLAAALLTGVYRPFWAAAIGQLILCIAASILSAALSLAFARTPYRRLARGGAIAHAAFLVALLAAVALMIATS